MRLSVRRITARAIAAGVSLLIPGLLFGVCFHPSRLPPSRSPTPPHW